MGSYLLVTTQYTRNIRSLIMRIMGWMCLLSVLLFIQITSGAPQRSQRSRSPVPSFNDVPGIPRGLAAAAASTDSNPIATIKSFLALDAIKLLLKKALIERAVKNALNLS